MLTQDFLEDELRNFGLIPEEYPCNQYVIYIKLLSEWNKTYNLTAVKKPKQMIGRHIVDSLSVLPYIKGSHCLDIGTGAGLPGMILAMTQPKKEWTLIDNIRKKVRFLNHVKHTFSMTNVEIIESRVEEFMPQSKFDTMICRAFAPLERLLQQTDHLFTSNNQLLAMKGGMVDEEIRNLTVHNFKIEVFDLLPLCSVAKSKLVKIRK